MFLQLYFEFLLPALYPLAIAVLSIFLSYQIYLKYKERQNRPLLNLSITYFFYVLAVLFADLGYFYFLFFGLTTSTNYFLKVWLDWSISLSMVAIGNYFHFWFAQELFSTEKKLTQAILGLATLVVVVIYFTINGFYDMGNLAYVPLMFLIVPVYFYIMISSYRAWKLANDPIYKRRYQLIFISAVLLPLVFVFFTLDLLLGAYGISFYLSWSMVLLSSLAAYFAYVAPSIRRENS
ncbi:MAG: hypothetical protein ACFFCZ_30215 [Promethearchaeota archaeon]